MNFIAQLGERVWMPDQASTYAYKVDNVFYFIFWASAIAFLIIMTAMIFFIIRYRHRSGHTAQPSPAHSTSLELTWSAIPAVVFFAIFYFSFRGFVDMATPPDYAYDINVIAAKWSWTFQYPNGATSPDLHIPMDRPVRLILQSQDVIHSLFIPAFRIKKDAVPGRYNMTWFQAQALPPVRSDGQQYYDLYCAEYCGTNHSLMRAKVFVYDSTGFNRWLDNAANWITQVPPAEAGFKLFQSKGCAQCHSPEPNKVIIGPSLHNFYGYDRPLRDGSKVAADENHIRESILVPSAKIAAGFDNVMPAYQGRLKDIEITALIEWMKSLSDKAPQPMKEFPKASPAASSSNPAADAKANSPTDPNPPPAATEPKLPQP